MSSLYGMPGHLVRRVHQISSALFAEECGGYGLTSVQYAALVAIRDNPGIDATRLSTIIAFDRSTLGDVLERLETRGWVVRHPGPNDKRIKLLTLAQAGLNVLDTCEPAVRRVQERLLVPLSGQDKALMVSLLAQLVDGFGGDVKVGPPDRTGEDAADETPRSGPGGQAVTARRRPVRRAGGG